MLEDSLRLAAARLKEAGALLITAGAGMGVDSGLPDFRGPEGFWKAYPAIAKLGLRFEQMANPDWFEKDPALAWAFYGHRLNLYRATQPHAGFRRLLEIARQKPRGYFVFTSNVDGHFQKAGFDPARVVEVHGSINHFQCVRPCAPQIWESSAADVTIDAQRFRARDPLPCCPNCGTLARPNILMFGDGLWIGSRSFEQESALEAWLNKLNGARLAIIELGAGSAIPTVRHFSEQTAREKDGFLIRINPRESQTPSGHIGLACGASEGIEKLIQAFPA